MTAFSSYLRPGVFVVENTAGPRTVPIASFQTCYLFGSATAGPTLTPTLIPNLTSFTNQFTASPSMPSVRLYERNDPQGQLFFIRVPVGQVMSLTVNTAAAGAYTLRVNSGANLTFTATGSDTTATIAAGLMALINADTSASAVVTAVAGSTAAQILVRTDNPTQTFTLVQVAGGFTVTSTTPTVPSNLDYIYAIQNTFLVEESWAQGFLIAPEVFQSSATATEKLAVANAMHGLCSNTDYDWIALIDCSTSAPTAQQLQTEGQTIVSPKGHSLYWAPYVIDLENNTVPPSAAIAGIWTRRTREQGIQQPPAGKQYPIQGVTDVTVRYSNADQNLLNPLNINLIRNLRNKGVLAYAMRTRSSDPFYAQCVTRIIMSVLNGTLRTAFDDDLFTSIDGRGILLLRMEETARSICRQLWRQGALFGNSEEEAFEVVCSFVNNNPSQLDQGNILVEVYCATSPSTEKVLAQTVRVGIGNVQAAAASGQQQ